MSFNLYCGHLGASLTSESFPKSSPSCSWYTVPCKKRSDGETKLDYGNSLDYVINLDFVTNFDYVTKLYNVVIVYSNYS